MLRRALATAAALVAVVALSACSDDEPPEWLVDRATGTTEPGVDDHEAPTATTVAEPGPGAGGVDLEPGLCIEDASELHRAARSTRSPASARSRAGWSTRPRCT